MASENAIFSPGRTLAEAWHRACKQAQVVGMLRREAMEIGR
jgi:hypothetical protein